MQPIKFIPILKETIWGGNKIPNLKRISGFEDRRTGESWEISGLEGNENIVDGGKYGGLPLSRLTDILKEKLVGADNYHRFGNRFPLLVKFIDARQDLSVQVHPDDDTARKHGMMNGKNEMWYLLESEPDATLRCGLKEELTPDDIKRKVADGTICDSTSLYKVNEGDCFYIPAGRVHSIRAGCLIAEIQQTSDTTYRLYDYNRRDKSGNLRQLHIEKAIECIDYSVKDDYQTHYRMVNNERVPLVECDYFKTSLYDINHPLRLDYSCLDSFVILVCVKGNGTLTDNDGIVTTLHECETLLVPATTRTLDVKGNIRILETYI